MAAGTEMASTRMLQIDPTELIRRLNERAKIRYGKYKNYPFPNSLRLVGISVEVREPKRDEA